MLLRAVSVRHDRVKFATICGTHFNLNTGAHPQIRIPARWRESRIGLKCQILSSRMGEGLHPVHKRTLSSVVHHGIESGPRPRIAAADLICCTVAIVGAGFGGIGMAKFASSSRDGTTSSFSRPVTKAQSVARCMTSASAASARGRPMPGDGGRFSSRPVGGSALACDGEPAPRALPRMIGSSLDFERLPPGRARPRTTVPPSEKKVRTASISSAWGAVCDQTTKSNPHSRLWPGNTRGHSLRARTTASAMSTDESFAMRFRITATGGSSSSARCSSARSAS
jgi:hypothetical protein